MKLSYDGKSDQWLPGIGAGGNYLGNVLCFDWGGGCMGTYICQNISNCALNMGAFYFMKFISQFSERVLRKRKYSDSLEWLRGPTERASRMG